MAYIGLPAGDPRAPYAEGADSYGRSTEAFAKTYGYYGKTSGLDTMEAYERGPMGAHWPFEPSVDVRDRTSMHECYKSDIFDPRVKPYICPMDLARDSHKGLYYDRRLMRAINMQNDYLLDESIRNFTAKLFAVEPYVPPSTKAPFGPIKDNRGPKPSQGPLRPNPWDDHALPMRIARPLGPLGDVLAQRSNLDSFEDRPERYRTWEPKPSYHFGYASVIVENK